MINYRLFRTVTVRETYSINAESPEEACRIALRHDATPVQQILDADDLNVVDSFTGKDMTPPAGPYPEVPARSVYLLESDDSNMESRTLIAFNSKSAAEAAAKAVTETVPRTVVITIPLI